MARDKVWPTCLTARLTNHLPTTVGAQLRTHKLEGSVMLPAWEKTERLSVWGDGFAEDGWVAMSAVQSVFDLDTDEYARLFPWLAARGTGVAPALLDHLATIVAFAADCLHQTPDGSNCAMPKTAEGAAADLRFLRGILLHFDEERAPPLFDEDERARFAFLSRIHPGYIWPESIITAERDAAAAWLGIIGSGRSAFMTIEVADYLADIMNDGADGDGELSARGQPRISDPYIAALASQVVDVSRLRDAARKRRRGVACIVDGRASLSWYEQMKTSLAVRAVTQCARLMIPSRVTPPPARESEGHTGAH